MFRDLLRIGSLRLALLVMAVAAIALAPFAGGEVQYSFPDIVTTFLAPPFAILIAFVVPLDCLMTGLFLHGAAANERRRLRLALSAGGVVWLALVISWAPYFLRLASGP